MIFAVPSIVLLYGGVQGGWGDWATWVGAGIAAYGAIYFGFHDVIVHQRLAHRIVPRSTYFKRIVQAHRIHHAVESREGTVSFGFIYAPPVEALKARARERARRRGSGRPRARVHSPSRLTFRAGSSASPNASTTSANFSAFEMLMRWSHARGPSFDRARRDLAIDARRR